MVIILIVMAVGIDILLNIKRMVQIGLPEDYLIHKQIVEYHQ